MSKSLSSRRFVLGLSLASLAGCSGAGVTSGASPSVAAAGRVVGSPTAPPVLTHAAARALPATAAASLLDDTFATDAIGTVPPDWSPTSGNWTICAPDRQPTSYCSTSADGVSLAGAPTWSDYTLQVTGASSNPSGASVAVLARVQDASHFYEFELRPDFRTNAPSWWIWKYDGGAWSYVAGAPLATNAAPIASLRFDVSGSQLSAYVEYAGASTWTSLGSGTDASYTTGKIGLRNQGSAANFSAVSVTGNGSNLTSVRALSAGSFGANQGVNVHSDYYGTAYENDPAAYESLAKGLGVGVLRDGESPRDPHVCAIQQTFAAAGLKFDFGGGIAPSSSDMADVIACVGKAAIKSFEGANEYDISHPSSDTNWPATLRASQQTLYAQAQAQLPGIDVIAPSVTTLGAAQSVGDLSAYATKGNDHIYIGGDRNPGTGPYGSNGYGSLAYDLAVEAPINGSRPVVVTESGFTGANGVSGDLSLATQAKYVGRNMLLLAQLGASSYYYELLDDGLDGFSNYSLVSAAYVPKPAYYAMKAILTLLADGGNATATGSLAYSVSGSTANVRTALLQKADGSYDLAIWIEAPSAAVDTGVDIAVPSQQVTLTLANAMAGSLYSYDSSWSFASKPLGTSTSFPLTVTDAVEFVALH